MTYDFNRRTRRRFLSGSTMNPHDKQPSAQPDCLEKCRSAFDDCVRNGVTADPCEDLYDRCAAVCAEDEAV